MSTPLTDSINALTAYANEVTGAEDATLSDAVGRLCEGYGEGNITANAIKQKLEKEGFVFSDFTVTENGSGYIAVPHILGDVPKDVVAFKKEFNSDNATYQFGATDSRNFGKDNARNRTCIVTDTGTNTGDIYKTLFTGYLKFERTEWNFSASATEEIVNIRNDSARIYTRMSLGDWWLGVR